MGNFLETKDKRKRPESLRGFGSVKYVIFCTAGYPVLKFSQYRLNYPHIPVFVVVKAVANADIIVCVPL